MLPVLVWLFPLPDVTVNTFEFEIISLICWKNFYFLDVLALKDFCAFASTVDKSWDPAVLELAWGWDEICGFDTEVDVGFDGSRDETIILVRVG